MTAPAGASAGASATADPDASGVPFELIVAADLSRGIARDGDLPWHLPGDLKHFARTTTGADPDRVNAVIMGRATWESIPPRYRPLAGRRNVVLSRRDTLALPPGVIHAHSVDEALALLSAPPLSRTVGDVFVVGGGEIYAETIKRGNCKGIYYTRINARFGCDTFFPAFEDDYELASVLSEGREGDVSYRIERWRPNR